MHAGDAFGLSNPVRFFEANDAHPLAGRHALLDPQGKTFFERPAGLNDRLMAAEILGHVPARAGTIPEGLIIRILHPLEFGLSTFSADHKEIRFEAAQGCENGFCPNEIHRVRLGQLIQQGQFDDLFQTLVPNVEPTVLRELVSQQIGWEAEQTSQILIRDAAIDGVSFNTGELTEEVLTSAASDVSSAQSSQTEAALREVFVGHTVRLSPNAMPDVFVYLDAGGEGVVYRETIQTQADPRRGTWSKSAWTLKDGQLCFPALAPECFALQVEPNLIRLVLQDTTKSWQPNVTGREMGDVLGLQTPERFYTWDGNYTRIGQSTLVRENRPGLGNGDIVTQGEIIGYLDALQTSADSGIFIRFESERQIQVYSTGEKELVIGFPHVNRCDGPCPDRIEFIPLAQEVTDADLNEILRRSYDIRSSGKSWRRLRKGLGLVLLGGLAYSALSPDEVAPSSHSATDDLADILIERMRRHEEEVNQRVNEAEEELRKAKEAYEEATEQAKADADGAEQPNPDPDQLRLENQAADFFSSDPYVVLGIKRDATKSEIKTAWRELIKRWHPDVQVGEQAKREAEEILKRVNWAYEKITS